MSPYYRSLHQSSQKLQYVAVCYSQTHQKIHVSSDLFCPVFGLWHCLHAVPQSHTTSSNIPRCHPLLSFLEAWWHAGSGRAVLCSAPRLIFTVELSRVFLPLLQHWSPLQPCLQSQQRGLVLSVHRLKLCCFTIRWVKGLELGEFTQL